MIASALAPNEIVVVGDITTVWYLVGPVVEAEMRQKSAGQGAARAAGARWRQGAIAQRGSAGDERQLL